MLNVFRNLFHLVIEYSWRRILAIFSCGFLVSWFTFGICYYLIVYMSGDLQVIIHFAAFKDRKRSALAPLVFDFMCQLFTKFN